MPKWRNWQTRNVQVVVWVSMYRFESCLGHRISPVDVILLGFLFPLKYFYSGTKKRD